MTMPIQYSLYIGDFMVHIYLIHFFTQNMKFINYRLKESVHFFGSVDNTL